MERQTNTGKKSIYRHVGFTVDCITHPSKNGKTPFYFFLLAGAGLGYDSAGNRLNGGDSHAPLMGDQHFAGFFHTGAGMLFNMGRGTALRVEYRFYHISEPFDTSDRGLNTHNVLVGISFR